MVCLLAIMFIFPMTNTNINAKDYGRGWRTVTQTGKIYTYDASKTYSSNYTVKVTIYNDPYGAYSGCKLVSYSFSDSALGPTYLEDFRAVEVNPTRTLVTFMISARFGGIVGSDYHGSAYFSASTAGPYRLDPTETTID